MRSSTRSPDDALSARKALDKATIERMVLLALKVPMLAQLDTAMPQVVAAIQAQRKLITKRMAAAARAGAASADVRTQLRDQLVERAAGAVALNVPGVVAFQTTTNFSNISEAATGVSAGFSTSALTTCIRDAYWKALGDAASKDIVAVKGLGDLSINVKGSVAATTATGGAQATAAAGAATTLVGTGSPSGGGTAPTGEARRPDCPPSRRRPRSSTSSRPCRRPGALQGPRSRHPSPPTSSPRRWWDPQGGAGGRDGRLARGHRWHRYHAPALPGGVRARRRRGTDGCPRAGLEPSSGAP